MNPLPPHAMLRCVVTHVVHCLEADYATLLGAPELEGLAPAVTALKADDSAIEDLGVSEAGWLAESLLARWMRLDGRGLPPAIAVLAPRERWVGEGPVAIRAELAQEGVDAIDEVEWTGAAAGERGATLEWSLPNPGLRDEIAIGVRAQVRLGTRRDLLTANHRIRLRRPELHIDVSRRRLVVRDQHGQPGKAIVLSVGELRLRTDPHGIIEFPEPLPEGAWIELDGLHLAV